MSENSAITTLNIERLKLIMERDVHYFAMNKKINQIEAAMEQLSGKKVWELEAQILYDDENPDYIKGSSED